MDTCGVSKLAYMYTLHFYVPTSILVCRDQYSPRRFSRRPRARLASRLPGLEGGVTSRLQHLQTPQQRADGLV